MASTTSETTNAGPLEMLTRMNRRRSFRSATQMLWDKLEGYASLYLLCCRRKDLTEEERDILKQCEAKLELARDCIDRYVKRPFSFWDVVHEVDGLLLLVIPKEMLLSRGLEILESFKNKVRDPIQRTLWLGHDKAEVTGPLPQAVLHLKGQVFSAEEGARDSVKMGTQDSCCRHTLRGALGVVNSQTDLGFWQLSINVTIQILSGVLIALLLAASIPIFAKVSPDAQVLIRDDKNVPIWTQVIIFGLFGLIGATLSNMLSKESFKVATGATTRWFFYYLFVKPLIGGFSALFVFLVERSTLLLRIVVGVQPQVNGPGNATVQIHVENEVQAFLVRAALGLVAGFFADRVLSSTMELVLGKILMKSEKTSPSVPKPEEAGEPVSP